MEKEQGSSKGSEKKGWFGKLVEKLDKKMEAKSRECCCCAPKDPKKGSSCC